MFASDFVLRFPGQSMLAQILKLPGYVGKICAQNK